MQELVLQGRDRLEPLREDAPPDSAPQRGRRVLAEVEAVLAEHSLEQEGELDLFEVVVGRRVLARTRRFPRGADRSSSFYLYSQTRISERSWSVSTGFVM